ncbi:CDP-diacylglycerol--glycerol-3-phosphate 3-phosphatidyltransferase [Mesomycoplasma ovipneumoniae]|uniref:CDP-diacylglycerol--glycerol-3-phosphate 3-phosphatidyltransferase n=1 Tax=Mesomycoplasma ovipneumoniae TaxID=29562 RepID=UPI002079B05A|nr:CDP-diacylglycerol--glycerol-3-phosphate 3-phosphatidyltransferase [Mesomycoplasma ovipneumoniae]MCN0158390.1 CDP-diacylglycerol--glycerol-3-phosphate 3-phosphatidyltransferase [Mesomycoplasma ovipneumoniae]MDO6825972.1 CDP-diacylglycerol--glycerol-3-phosphate 3-phosphatidyltransferase [Mesomycoplasma ovipneumoniae]
MKKKIDILFYFINFLTFFRLLGGLIIFVLLYLFSKYNYFSLFYIAFFFFVASSLTDFLDGYLARKFSLESELGKIFDPITDKILTTTTFFLLSYLELTPWYLVLVFVLRDIIVDGFRIFLAKKNINVAANFLGKLKTVLQILAIIIIFLGYSISAEIFIKDYYLFNLATIFAAIISVISGIYYVAPVFKLVKK